MPKNSSPPIPSEPCGLDPCRLWLIPTRSYAFVLGFSASSLRVFNVAQGCTRFFRQCFLQDTTARPKDHTTWACRSMMLALSGESLSNGHTGVMSFHQDLNSKCICESFRMGQPSVRPYGRLVMSCPVLRDSRGINAAVKQGKAMLIWGVCKSRSGNMNRPAWVKEVEEPAVGKSRLTQSFPITEKEGRELGQVDARLELNVRTQKWSAVRQPPT